MKNSKLIKTFFIGFFGFPLAAGFGFGVSMIISSVLTGGNIPNELLGIKGLLFLITTAPFIAILAAPFIVWPIYIFIGLPIWYVMRHLNIKTCYPYLASVGLVTIGGTTAVLGDFGDLVTKSHGNGERLVTTVKDGTLTADGWLELISYNFCMTLFSLIVGYIMWKILFINAQETTSEP